MSESTGGAGETVSHLGALTIEVDRGRCMGSGNCVVWAPGIFALGHDNLVTLVTNGDDTPENVSNAAMNCPVRAITVTTRGQSTSSAPR